MRTVLLLCFGSILLWDFFVAPTGESAVMRATRMLYDRVYDEVVDIYERSMAEKAPTRTAIVNPDPMVTLPSPDVPSLPPIEAERGEADPSTVSLIDRLNGQWRALTSVFSRQAVDEFIDVASARTGVSPVYLTHLAERESDFNPVAEAGTSSAAGLYQFIEQTWLDLMVRHGASLDQADLARAIRMDAFGRYYVADDKLERRILDLRFDPLLSTHLAAHYTNENRDALAASLDRDFSYAELYMAHFLGAAGAIRLFTTVAAAPDTKAETLFPAAAKANRSFFYDGAGRAVSADVLYERLLSRCADLDTQLAYSASDGAPGV